MSASYDRRSTDQSGVSERRIDGLKEGTPVPMESAIDTTFTDAGPGGLTDFSNPTATFEEVDIRAALCARPQRAPDYEAEHRAMEVLAAEMATNPRNMLQKLAETAVELCKADTAGVSILEGDLVRWEALAGVFASYRGSTMPRDASPCGVCINQNATQLMHLPDRCFPALTTDPPFVEVLLIPFHDHGKPVGTVWIVANNFERKFDREDERVVRTLAQFASAGWQLWQASERSAESSRHKDQFLAMLAHEFRNPLTAIVGAHQAAQKISGHNGDLMRPDPLRTDLRQAVDIIGRQARHLTRMVTDLMDLSRIGRGGLGVCKEPVELKTIVDQAVEATHAHFKHRRHRLSVGIPEEPVHIDGDPARLVQLLSNLLDNAAKYTLKDGEISIAADCTDKDVFIRVRDNGIGIPKDRIESIFDLYIQLNGSAKSARGLGLGLTIVKNLVTLHGGAIEAASDGPGKGSVFTVRLPLTPRFAKHLPKKATGQKGRRILLVEDSDDIARPLKKILAWDGHLVSVAPDGALALGMLRTFKPDIVFLDIGLPDMDGFEVARRMRHQADSAGLVIVAFTGYSDDEHRRLSREAGCDYHLVKPISSDVLLSFLGRPADSAESARRI